MGGGGFYRIEGVSLFIVLLFLFIGGEEGFEFLRRKLFEIYLFVVVLLRYWINVCMLIFVFKICLGFLMSYYNGFVINLNIK